MESSPTDELLQIRTAASFFGLHPLAPSDEGAGKTPVLTEGEIAL